MPWPEFLKRGQYHAEDKRIEPGPGRIVNELLKSGERDAAFARIQVSERAAQRESSNKPRQWNDKRRASPTIDKDEKQRQRQIELVLDRQRPRMRKRGPAAQVNVLDGDQEFPERRYLRKFAQRRQAKVNREDDKIGGHDS